MTVGRFYMGIGLLKLRVRCVSLCVSTMGIQGSVRGYDRSGNWPCKTFFWLAQACLWSERMV